MRQKEDLVHQSDQPVLNSLKWPKKKLTMILTSVLLLTMFGLGGYWLGAKQQQSSSINLLTKPNPSLFLSATPAQQRSVTPLLLTPEDIENAPRELTGPFWRESTFMINVIVFVLLIAIGVSYVWWLIQKGIKKRKT